MTASTTRSWRRDLSCALAVALAFATVEPAYPASPPRQGALTATDAGSAGIGAREPVPAEPPSDVLGPPSNVEKEGYGCLITGGAATALTAVAGTEELLLLYGSTVVPATTPISFLVAITGTIFASVCVVGALATPAVLRLWNYYYVGIPLAEPR